MHIEKRYHMELKKQVNYTRQMYAEKFWNMTLEMNPFDEVQYRNVVMRELETYQMLFVNFTRKGYDGFTDEETSSQWSFAGAFLYSLTVITTIGEYLYQLYLFLLVYLFRLIMEFCGSLFVIL